MTQTKTYTLSQDPKKKDWVLLVKDGKRATKRFASKTEASAKAIRTAVGADGGMVSILKGDGTLQSTLTVKSTKPTAKPVAKSPAKKSPGPETCSGKKTSCEEEDSCPQGRSKNRSQKSGIEIDCEIWTG